MFTKPVLVLMIFLLAVIVVSSWISWSQGVALFDWGGKARIERSLEEQQESLKNHDQELKRTQTDLVATQGFVKQNKATMKVVKVDLDTVQQKLTILQEQMTAQESRTVEQGQELEKLLQTLLQAQGQLESLQASQKEQGDRLKENKIEQQALAELQQKVFNLLQQQGQLRAHNSALKEQLEEQNSQSQQDRKRLLRIEKILGISEDPPGV